MNYGTTTYIYGSSKLSLKYEDKDLNKLIEAFMVDSGEFSFTQLCNYVLSVADQQGMLMKEPNTSYSQILLTQKDTIRICRILWEHIWNKELIQLFNNPHDMYRNNGETYFVVIK